MFFSLTRPVFSICHTPFTLYITFIVVAERLSMAPASIFADHLAMKFAMVKPGDTEALASAGARLTMQSAARLVKLLQEWKERQAEGQAEVQPPSAVGGGGATADGVHSHGARPDAPGVFFSLTRTHFSHMSEPILPISHL